MNFPDELHAQGAHVLPDGTLSDYKPVRLLFDTPTGFVKRFLEYVAKEAAK